MVMDVFMRLIFPLLSPIIGLDGNTVKEYQLIIFYRKMSQGNGGRHN
jgi:hypothetical protein